MIEDNTLVIVRNRNAGSTRYMLDNGVSRHFEHNEVKKIPFGELKTLAYTNMVQCILKDCLVIENEEALLLNLEVEPEYFYSEEEVKTILLNGTLDQLEDMLNFAPDGIIEIVKKLAVSLEILDIHKRDMISEKTGFSINNAINVN